MRNRWTRWLAFLVLAAVLGVVSCQALWAPDAAVLLTGSAG